MIEEKLSKLNDTIPEFNNKEAIKKNILKKYDNRNINKKASIMLRFTYCIIPVFSLLLCLVIGIAFMPLLGGEKMSEYEKRQQELSKLYLSGSKNYHSDYIKKLDGKINDGFESEYVKYLLELNSKLEEETVIEDIYYVVTIDYANGTTPSKIVVKKGELVYPEVFSRSGYYFLGWFVNEKVLTQALRITEDTTIYAKWSVKESITIDNNYYEYYIDQDGIVIVGSKMQDSEIITIPSKINDLDVIALEANSFNGSYSNNHNITKKIIIPDTVKIIKAVALANYYKLEEIYLPKNLEVLYTNALIGCSKLKHIYIEDNGNYKVLNDALIDIRTNTLVKGTLNSSDIPYGIKIIEARAFSDYKTLEKINIPESVEVIKDSAFSNCESLTMVKLPENIKVIDDGIFRDCSNLEEVYIGKNLEIIDESAFIGCNKLKSIIVNEENKKFYSTNSCLVDRTTKTLVVGLNVEDGIVIIPDGIKTIARNAFYGRTSLKKVTLSESVEIIEYSAFEECTNLEYVYLNKNLKELEGYTFVNCIKLKEVIMPTTIEHIGHFVFWRCESLEHIVLPQGIETIPYGMFLDCKSLVSVELQSKIHTIEESAFSNCNSLKEFDLSNIQKIGNDAFSYCRSLKEIDLGDVTSIGDRAFLSCIGLTTVYIPKTLSELGSKSFGNLRNTIIYCAVDSPSALWAKDFADDSKCFYNSSEVVSYLGLTFTVINNNELELTAYTEDEKIVIIPDTIDGMKVTSIAEKVFYLKKLEEVVIPNTITVIKESAFSSCEGLKKVEIPSSVREIKEYAFSNCSNLEELKLNEGLEVLGRYAFSRCNLKVVIIPSTLRESVGPVFSDNQNLVEFVNLSQVSNRTLCQTAINYYDSLDYQTGIFVIDDEFVFCFDYENKKISFIEYTGTDVIIKLPEVSFTVGEEVYTTYVIRDKAFAYNKRVVKIDLPEGVTEIGERAFFACFCLTSLYIPSTVTKIGSTVVANDEHLFEVYNLSSLTDAELQKSGITFYVKEVHKDGTIPSKVVRADNGLIYYVGGNNNNYIVGYDYVNEHLVLPNNINNESYIIANHVFNNNQTIKTVVLPEGITEIHRNAFADCENIKELVIPTSVVKIKWYAFYSMGSLEKVTFLDPTPWIIKTQTQPASYVEIDVTDPKLAAKSLLRDYMFDWNKKIND